MQYDLKFSTKEQNCIPYATYIYLLAYFSLKTKCCFSRKIMKGVKIKSIKHMNRGYNIILLCQI